MLKFYSWFPVSLGTMGIKIIILLVILLVIYIIKKWVNINKIDVFNIIITLIFLLIIAASVMGAYINKAEKLSYFGTCLGAIATSLLGFATLYINHKIEKNNQKTQSQIIELTNKSNELTEKSNDLVNKELKLSISKEYTYLEFNYIDNLKDDDVADFLRIFNNKISSNDNTINLLHTVMTNKENKNDKKDNYLLFVDFYKKDGIKLKDTKYILTKLFYKNEDNPINIYDLNVIDQKFYFLTIQNKSVSKICLIKLIRTKYTYLEGISIENISEPPCVFDKSLYTDEKIKLILFFIRNTNKDIEEKNLSDYKLELEFELITLNRLIYKQIISINFKNNEFYDIGYEPIEPIV